MAEFSIDRVRDWPYGLHPAPGESRADFQERCRHYFERQERLYAILRDKVPPEVRDGD